MILLDLLLPAASLENGLGNSFALEGAGSNNMSGLRGGLVSAAALAGIFWAVSGDPVSAQNSKKTQPVDSNFVSNAFYEIGTEYLFGFTQGTDIGQPLAKRKLPGRA